MMPKISVVMPIHNAANYFSSIIESVLNQTLTDFELIVIDDNSSDETCDIVSGYSLNDNRIKLIKNTKNIGAGASRNIGLNEAQGKYVLFLDDDDVIENDMFESIFFKSEELDLDVLCYRSRFIDYNSQEKTLTPWTIRAELLPKKEVFSGKDIEHNFFSAFVWWPWDKLFKREFIISTGVKFQEIRTTNDLTFTATQTLLADRIGILNKILINHTVSRSGSLENSRNSSYACAVEALVQLKTNLELFDLYSLRRKDYLNYCVSFLEWNANTLSGESFFSFFELCREYLLSLNITKEDLYDTHSFTVYKDLVTLEGIDYIFKLKSDLLTNLNQANKEIDNLRIINSDVKRIRNARKRPSETSINHTEKYNALQDLLLTLTHDFAMKRKSLFLEGNGLLSISAVSDAFSLSNDFNQDLNDKKYLISDNDFRTLTHLKIEHDNILKVITILRNKIEILENK